MTNELHNIPKCYCGGKFVKNLCEDVNMVCSNCFEKIPKGNNTNWCAENDCTFFEINGERTNICSDCIKILPTNNQAENLLRFAIESLKTKSNEKRKTNLTQLKLYTCRIRRILRIINNYLNASKLSQTAHDKLINSFDELYNEMNEHVTKNHDQFQLELNEYVLCINDETETETEEKTIDLKKKNRFEWLLIVNSNNENYDETTCPYMAKCKMVKRISYLLKLYQTYCVADNGENNKYFTCIFNSCLSSYKITDMINDFIHIIETHNSDADKERLTAYYVDLCEDENCNTDENIIIATKDNRESMILSHCHSLHSYFAHKNSTIKIENFEKHKSKKFLNKFQTTLETKQEVIEQKENNIIETKQDVIEQKQNRNEVGKFSFGTTFYYWPYFSDYIEYIAKPKYKSLKQELLNNNIFALTNEEFNTLVFKALQFILCNKAKKMKAKDRGLNNEKYAMPVNLGLTISHLMVLLTYTNYTDLQFVFKQHGTRKMNSNDSFNDIKYRNTKIANWFRLLYEVVIFFGEDTTIKEP
eukprot:284565_1